jgi:hypothetical protein
MLSGLVSNSRIWNERHLAEEFDVTMGCRLGRSVNLRPYAL